ncbi:MAG: helix-turn-helix domain-containing protein [Acidimicrobiales bacterium]
MANADLLLHPVRLRIVQAFLGDRRLTTGELAAELADVPAGSLYRHVGRLARTGVLRVVSERRVRGASERTYALNVAAAQVGPTEAAALGPEDHSRAFLAFAASLLAAFDRYREGTAAPDLARDGVGYRMAGLWLTDEELGELVHDVAAVVASRRGYRPGPGRRHRLVAGALLPLQPSER